MRLYCGNWMYKFVSRSFNPISFMRVSNSVVNSTRLQLSNAQIVYWRHYRIMSVNPISYHNSCCWSIELKYTIYVLVLCCFTFIWIKNESWVFLYFSTSATYNQMALLYGGNSNQDPHFIDDYLRLIDSMAAERPATSPHHIDLPNLREIANSTSAFHDDQLQR